MEKITDNNTYIMNFWWSNNYGAILTAFALQRILKNFNVKSELVNNTWEYYKLTNKKKYLSANFADKYLSVTTPVEKYSDYLKLNDNGNIFITGSDQVFRFGPNLDDIYEYFLPYVDDNKKKIAFSASFGVDRETLISNTTKQNIDDISNLLKSFDFISVREKSGVDICENVFDVKAEWIIDPVFIAEKSDYEELIANTSTNYKNKIVAYVLDTSGKYKKAYKYLSAKYNKKVVETANSNISVEDWINSVKDSELFITDSFHGMCFAIIFNKPFICIANKKRGKSRFDSICEMLGIENQCVDSVEEVYKNDCLFNINYEEVNKKIDYERQRGLNFLKTALESSVKNTQEKLNIKKEYLENKIIELENKNNISSQIKIYIWKKWLTLYHQYLPKIIKLIIGFLKNIIKKGYLKSC